MAAPPIPYTAERWCGNCAWSYVASNVLHCHLGQWTGAPCCAWKQIGEQSRDVP